MKKNLFFAAIASMMLFSCTKEPGSESGSSIAPTFSEISFLADENPEIISTDIVISNPSVGRVDVTFPIEADESKFNDMAMNFSLSDAEAVVIIKVEEEIVETVGEGEDADEIKKTQVVEKEVKSGDKLDFSSALDIYVRKDNKTSIYSIVCKPDAVGLNWKLLASTDVSEANPQGYYSDPALSIAPNGTIYLAGKCNGEKAADRKAMLLKANAAGRFEYAISDKYLSDNGADFVSVAISSSNVPYVAFQENNKVSVMKVENNTASYVGEKEFMYRANQYTAIVLNSSDNPWACAMMYAAAGGLAKRALNLAYYNGSSWTQELTPAGRSASDYGYSGYSFAGNGKKYLLIYNQNSASFSCYDLSGTTCTTVFEAMKIKQTDGETEMASSAINTYPDTKSFFVDASGNIYLALYAKFDGENFKTGVVKFTQTNNTWSQTIVGGVFGQELGGASRNYVAIVVDSADLLHLFASTTTGKLCESHIDNQTKQWTNLQIISGADYRSKNTSSPSWASPRAALYDGKIYVAVMSQADKHTDIYVTE